MEPTDQPPPTPQTWAETSAWAPSTQAYDPATGAGPPAAWAPPPPALQQTPTPDDYVRPAALQPDKPVKIARDRSPVRVLTLAAVITELIAIAAGCNQWVGAKVSDYVDGTASGGILHQTVLSTQTFGWRVSKASGQDTSSWLASFARIAVVVVLSALIIGIVARRGSFWRAAITTLTAVVFATGVGSIVAAVIDHNGGPRRYIDYLPVAANGVLYGGGNTSVSAAIFGDSGPNSYRFVGGVILGAVVAVVVGLVARSLGEDEPEFRQHTPPTPQAPTQTFFPTGDLRRGYEESTAARPVLSDPGAAQSQDGGRHARG